MEMLYCKGCFMPSTRPRISFDKHGYCNGCTYNKSRKDIVDWNARKSELEEIVKRNKKSSSNNTYDCVVGWSGGKDSSAVAISLKKELGLNPLLVTFAPLIPTIEGEFNRRNLLEYGFDSILVTPNQKISRYLSKKFLIERGDPKVHWNAGINAVTINVASAYKIPTVFYSEHGESEYGGRILDEKSTMERSIDEIMENQIGDDPRNWTDSVVNQRDLEPYIINESNMEHLQILYYAHFFSWDIVQNIELVENEVKFMRNNRGRTYGTFTDFDSLDDVMDDLYYYMQYIKFGFGRCLRDCARQIQRNRMTRREAFELISNYDGELPTESLDLICSYLDIPQNELMKIVDLHRRPDVWECRNGNWMLRNPLKPEEV
jgi:N-acetyl sugar amidotransferase